MYQYHNMKPALFTEEGTTLFIKIRDHTRNLLDEAGAVRATEAMEVGIGDSWLKMACIDRMVELNELREVTSRFVKGQSRVFVSNF